MKERFKMVGGKPMRYGYTTGSCAAAAAKAAVMHLYGIELDGLVEIDTPKGWRIEIPLEKVVDNGDSVEVTVIKDGGDDPDVTHGIEIVVTAVKLDKNAIEVDGGVGVGRVTKRGLRVSVGQAAINPVPMAMIQKEAGEVLPPDSGVSLTVSIPRGEEIALKTFNPKLGIIGGISVLGTSGIVEPMSEDAFKKSLKLELAVKAADGLEAVTYVFGNFGRDWMEPYGISEGHMQKTSNFVAYMLKAASELGISRLLYVGHIGKMVKVAAGMENTHSKYGDNRMTSIANCIGDVHWFDKEKRSRILQANTTDEAIDILKEWDRDSYAMDRVAKVCKAECEKMSGHRLEVECIVFSTIHGELARTSGASQLLKVFCEEMNND